MAYTNSLVKPFKKIREFWYKLSRSTRWFIRMWNNYDWDDGFLIEMMVLKMKDMRHQLDVVDRKFVDLRHQPIKLNDDGTTGVVDELAGLDRAIEVGERLLKHDYVQYTPNILKYFEERGVDILPITQLPDELQTEMKEVYKKSSEDEKKDWTEFFNTIRDEHHKWWS